MLYFLHNFGSFINQEYTEMFHRITNVLTRNRKTPNVLQNHTTNIFNDIVCAFKYQLNRNFSSISKTPLTTFIDSKFENSPDFQVTQKSGILQHEIPWTIWWHILLAWERDTNIERCTQSEYHKVTHLVCHKCIYPGGLFG